jgi:hypothetical protein
VSDQPSNSRGSVKIAGLVGFGLDNQDGHKRLTTGEKFAIVGGSEDTHGRMTETVIKTFEVLKQKGKDISEVGVRELSDIVAKSAPR